MKLPIIAYGDSVLRKKGADITAEYPDLNVLIANMFETMYGAHGVGLAAPQIGLSIRLFVIDATSFAEDEPALKDFKKVFINAEILEENGEKWSFNEGCLSIPDVREDIDRKQNVTIAYFDENWEEHEETFSGLAARIIQHEYDHIEGKLFTDIISPFKRKLIAGKLSDIAKGRISADYKTRVYKPKK